MDGLDTLLACAGTWHGGSRLQDPATNAGKESDSTLAVVPMLGARFVRLDYGWAYDGAPQEGSLLLGYEPTSQTISAHWIDSWHMGRAVMTCVGTAGGNPTVSVRGSYPVAPGPDWGWRIELTPSADDRLRLVMINISPDGAEELAVEASYSRTAR